jgi:hypothetical protein
MRKLLAALLSTALLAALAAAPASADFGLNGLDLAFTDSEGNPAMEAGTHPFAMRTTFNVNEKEVEGKRFVDGAIRGLDITFPAGFIGNPTAVPRCETIDFLTLSGGIPECSDSTALGLLTVIVAGGLGIIAEETVPIYSLRPAPGVAQKLGFTVQEVPITVNAFASPTPPYNVVGSLSNTTQVLEVFSSVTTLWGNPADPAHDEDRGACGYSFGPDTCPAGIPVKPFLTLPRSCTGPLSTLFQATSWWTGDPLFPDPPETFEDSAQSEEVEACANLNFSASMEAQLTTESAESPSGLDLSFDVEDEGLVDPDGTAHSDIEKAVLTLPEGMTANPSLAEGLGTCSLEELGRETFDSQPGEGCPQASKVGTVEAETPILEGRVLKGNLYVAAQNDPARPGKENPFDSLLAVYVVVKEPTLGVIIKQPGKIEPDPVTGQLVATFEDLPPYPIGHLRTRLREGGRSPLISPARCGPYEVEAELTPSGDPTSPLTTTSEFEIVRGVGGGSCPPAGPQPFAPDLVAGTLNNNAGSYSPFYLRLTRRDGDQDLTRFDATLPRGLAARLAGVAKCPDAAIAAAKAKAGRAELASPSCPPDSEIGNVIGGAGVGSQLTYAKGKLYMAGPFGGAPLSVVGVVPAVAGPFDVGTVVVRQALDVDPRTAVGRIDGANSDPIPHILAGIPLRVRDVRVYVDRPQFTLNPTSCDPFATTAQIWGGGSNVFSKGDDAPVTRTARFQAANCSRLGFKPRLSLTLKGGTKRGSNPAFRGTYTPRPGDANAADLITRLPRSAFLDQGHIRTICTRVQFAADACPPGAIYGRATAFTPLLEEPLEGPVYLRSSNHNLPDMVLDLHGLVDIEVSARIDSIKGGIRASFEDAPDAPLTKFVLEMRGGRKGLIVNSRNICAGKTSRASVELTAQSGKERTLRPKMRATGCGGRAKAKQQQQKRRARG